MNQKIWEQAGGKGTLTGLLLALVVSGGSLAAQAVDPRWLPWLGCWEAVEGGEETPLLCIRPFPGGGVEFVTWAEGRILSTEILQADGVAREVEREGCRGTENARFSADGGRVFLKASYTCEDGRQRSASGILAVLNPSTWVDIKVAGDGVRKAPWALRYRAARTGRVAEAGLEVSQPGQPRAIRDARLAAGSPLTPEDVVEAVRAVDAEAVEALIVEQGQGFQLNAKTLLALDEAGVPGRVVDVMVATSYPSRFVVRSGEVEDRAGEAPARGGYGVYPRPFGWSVWNPWLWDDPFFGYYGYWGYGVYPYGYGYGGWGWGGYYYRPVRVIIEPNQREEAPERARMIRGQGATRGGAPEPTTSRDPNSGSGGAAASSGGSSGSGSSSTGRTAVRRGGGGGG